MVPANNAVIGILGVLGLVDMRPSVLCKGYVRSGLGRVCPGNARFDRETVFVFAADQDATNLRLAIGAGVLADLPENFAVDNNGRLGPLPVVLSHSHARLA
jgi:hypothetical protein